MIIMRMRRRVLFNRGSKGRRRNRRLCASCCSFLPSTLGTRITRHTLRFGIFNQTIAAFDDFKLVGRPNTKLHGGPRLLTARAAVTPTRQISVAFHTSFKFAAHAFPTTSRRRHDDDDSSSSSSSSLWRSK